MIFRLTQKLGKKVGVNPSQCLPPDPNPFADWTGHLFTAQRTQYIIVTNTPSLYSMVMYGRGITDDNQLLQRLLSYMCDFMTEDGYEFLFRKFVVPHTGRVAFSKTGDRRVLGSINDLVDQAKFHLVGGDASPFDVSFRLNATPMSMLDYRSPREAFKGLETGGR